MTSRSTVHSTFVIEREFAAPAPRVFAAWSDESQKRRWFACHDDWSMLEYRLDFRVGGRELNAQARPDGVVHRFEARYFDIIPDERIVYAYAMRIGDANISVSLVTVELERRRAKTAMTFTEQVVFLDGPGDVDERREGTEVGLTRLAAQLDALE